MKTKKLHVVLSVIVFGACMWLVYIGISAKNKNVRSLPVYTYDRTSTLSEIVEKGNIDGREPISDEEVIQWLKNLPNNDGSSFEYVTGNEYFPVLYIYNMQKNAFNGSDEIIVRVVYVPMLEEKIYVFSVQPYTIVYDEQKDVSLVRFYSKGMYEDGKFKKIENDLYLIEPLRISGKLLLDE